METTGTVDQSDVRAHLRQMWAAVAPGWAEHADYADARGNDVAEQMLQLTRPEPGEDVLELACGPGGLGCAAAARVAPRGEVVLSDVVPEMVDIATARAAARRLENVRGAILDLEEIAQPDSSYDVVLCREGLMFATDPQRAANEIARVLRPGGRAAVAVWGPRDRNPWLAIVMDAVSAELGMPVPPPGLPGPFSLSDASRLGELLERAGLVGVAVVELPAPARAPGFDDWWTRTRALAGPLSKLLASLAPERGAAIRERAREACRPYETRDGLELPGVTLLASGRAA